jgi:hypothetical protein
MNYYFMPRIEGLKCSVTLANFPCVEGERPWSLEQVLHVTWSQDSIWQVRALDTVLPGKSVVCASDELPPELPCDISPFFFFHPKKLPSTLDRLISSDLMLTSPNWRANIQLSSPTTSTSYQGEYPGSMLGVERGTLLSLGPLVQLKTGLTSKLILVNLGAKPGNEIGQIRFAQMRRRKILHETNVLRNHCNIIDLPTLNCEGSDDPICVFSNDLTGIPIFLTHDLGFKKMSLEHTHPPAEMLVGGDKGKFQKQMKGWWLSKINKHADNN